MSTMWKAGDVVRMLADYQPPGTVDESSIIRAGTLARIVDAESDGGASLVDGAPDDGVEWVRIETCETRVGAGLDTWYCAISDEAGAIAIIQIERVDSTGAA